MGRVLIVNLVPMPILRTVRLFLFRGLNDLDLTKLASTATESGGKVWLLLGINVHDRSVGSDNLPAHDVLRTF